MDWNMSDTAAQDIYPLNAFQSENHSKCHNCKKSEWNGLNSAFHCSNKYCNRTVSDRYPPKIVLFLTCMWFLFGHPNESNEKINNDLINCTSQVIQDGRQRLIYRVFWRHDLFLDIIRWHFTCAMQICHNLMWTKEWNNIASVSP